MGGDWGTERLVVMEGVLQGLMLLEEVRIL